jgi:hypothetical protein
MLRSVRASTLSYMGSQGEGRAQRTRLSARFRIKRG